MNFADEWRRARAALTKLLADTGMDDKLREPIAAVMNLLPIHEAELQIATGARVPTRRELELEEGLREAVRYFRWLHEEQGEVTDIAAKLRDMEHVADGWWLCPGCRESVPESYTYCGDCGRWRVDQAVATRPLDKQSGAPCSKCDGERWVWGSELDPAEDPQTDQRYPCPLCQSDNPEAPDDAVIDHEADPLRWLLNYIDASTQKFEGMPRRKKKGVLADVRFHILRLMETGNLPADPRCKGCNDEAPFGCDDCAPPPPSWYLAVWPGDLCASGHKEQYRAEAEAYPDDEHRKGKHEHGEVVEVWEVPPELEPLRKLAREVHEFFTDRTPHPLSCKPAHWYQVTREIAERFVEMSKAALRLAGEQVSDLDALMEKVAAEAEEKKRD